MTGKSKVQKQLAMLIVGCALATIPAFADDSSPKDIYLKYRGVLASAKKVEEIQPMLCKKVNQQINGTPADQKPMMFEFMKMSNPSVVEVVSEEVKGDAATLKLTGKTMEPSADTKEKTTGKVTLVKEDGGWKIEKEAWDSNIQVGGDVPPRAK